MKKPGFPEGKNNLKRNWYFPISAMAFFCISIDNSVGYCVGMLIAFAAMTALSARIPSIWARVSGKTKGRKIFCFLSALGICLGNQEQFMNRALQLMLPERFNIYLLALSWFGAAAAFCFVYICLVLFWDKLLEILRENGAFSGITKAEWVIYGVLALLSIGFAAWAFSESQIFYGTEHSYDLLYTSDSPALIKGGVYHTLTHKQNDIRQPLFALFAAPFEGIPYLVGRLLNAPAPARAILINSAQILLLFAANLLLTRMLALSPGKRICFQLVSCCSYTHLLFILMMEQYIVAYFWLVLCMYLIAQRGKPERFALWGAGGTLLTSMVLMPFLSEKHPVREFKDWFLDMVKAGLEFVAVILLFSRLDVITGVVQQAIYLDSFTGRTLTMMDKLQQFTAFLPGCFAAPAAGPNQYGWYLMPVTCIHTGGIVIAALAVLSAVVNRKQKSSLLALYWCGFSAVMLVGLGWGTSENGLILYALYFGWAYLALLFQLVEKAEAWLKIKNLTCVVSAVCAVWLAAVNIPAILELVRFAAAVHPA